MISGVIEILLTSPGPRPGVDAASYNPQRFSGDVPEPARNVRARACARITISLKSNFTNHFGAQKSSDLPPAHSGLVLTRGVTNYLFGYCFKRIDRRLIADVPGISRDVFKSDLKIHIGL